MKQFITTFFLGFPFFLSAQILSELHADRNSALYTTYAAPLSRSEYKLDQGYQLLWNDSEQSIEFISKDGPNLGIMFTSGAETRLTLGEFYQEPIVTVSYSDLVNYFYYPFKNIRVDVFFAVYSSQLAVSRYRIVNESAFSFELGIFPFFFLPSNGDSLDFEHTNITDGYTFNLLKKRDSWMVEHNIPFVEKIRGLFMTSLQLDSVSTFSINPGQIKDLSNNDRYSRIKSSVSRQKLILKRLNLLIGSRSLRMAPGDTTEFRIVVGLAGTSTPLDELSGKSRALLTCDLHKLVKDDERAYSHIPLLDFKDHDQEMLYWSAFSLLRQCMMPPEGECHYNYYIFSREPKWGWGYGGQVFHESLAMLAYAYMDPIGAMNSQRVYMERQTKDGYINYRTGPYLNEIIETNGKLTSSAPWYNYQNLEIYNITKDKKFLKEAYVSGKNFYQFYIANRDSNQNGLCEWGAHAELESVRDARVAVWDKVGWPANFEGPDLNAMLVKEAKSLAKMAKILGITNDIKKWENDAESRAALINKFCWDSLTHFYYNVNRKDQTFTYKNQGDLKIKEIIGFLPLWAGVSDKERTVYLINKMKDPEEFWRPFGVPTLSAKSDYYNPIGYWNGPVWIQWDYLLFRGLLDKGYHQDAEELVKRVTENMIYHLKNDHVFWEFYSPDDFQAGWNKTYIWAGIASRFFIDLYGLNSAEKK